MVPEENSKARCCLLIPFSCDSDQMTHITITSTSVIFKAAPRGRSVAVKLPEAFRFVMRFIISYKRFVFKYAF